MLATCEFDCGDAEDLTQRLEAAADAILNSGKTLLGLGGDHFITLPLLRAYGKKYGEMALIHSMHTDTYSHGSRYDHGTMFYHARNEGLSLRNTRCRSVFVLKV